MRRSLALLLPIVLAGCGVATVDDAQPVSSRNECKQDSECDGGSCSAGVCVADQGSFSTLLIEVTPPADADAIAGVRFFKRWTNLNLQGGVQDLNLERVAKVSGTLEPAKAADQPCVFSSGGPQARLTFTPTERLLGLPVARYTATTVNRTGASDLDARSFSLNMPAGKYDLYVQDASTPESNGVRAEASVLPADCPIVPTLIRQIDIVPGAVVLPIAQPLPARLDLQVHWTSAHSLSDWVVDIVEPFGGRVISTRSALGQAADGSYAATLYYSPITEGAYRGRELVRLSPPEDNYAPSVLFERASLELFARGQGIINQLDTLPQSVMVDGQVETFGSGKPLAASLSFVATELSSLAPGTLASFRQATTSDDQGHFSVRLLPGHYRVHAIPSGASAAAATKTDLEVAVAPQFQAGKVIELKDLRSISGTVFGPSGRHIWGASVQAQATPQSIDVSVLDAALGDEPFVPRTSGCTRPDSDCVRWTDKSGYFSIEADPGAFDVSIRPPDDSGFPWLVRRNVDVEAKSQNLGTLSMPLPVLYRGVVSSEGRGAIAGALIRAYIYVDQNGYTGAPSVTLAAPNTVLQIAESRAGEDGGFVLRIPASLDQ